MNVLTHSGVTGTFEGYVATNKDIYNRGTWGSGYNLSNFGYVDGFEPTDSNNFEEQPSAIKADNFWFKKLIDFTPYTKLSLVISFTKNSDSVKSFKVYATMPPYVTNNTNLLAEVESRFASANAEFTMTVDISAINRSGYFTFFENSTNIYGLAIHRIYFT